MKRISATFVYTGKNIFEKAIIEIDDTGKVLNIIDTKGQIKEQESLEYYNGLIVPGFVNTHCHLELSHMKGVIDSKTVKGLPGFIDEIISKRNFPEDLSERIHKADREMRSEGIVAVGDISNTDDSFSIKGNSDIYYHTFVEAFSTSNATATEAFSNAVSNFKKLKKNNLKATIVPHASYSVPDQLRKKIIDHNKDQAQIISIHNQETPWEDDIIKTKSSELAEVMIKKGFIFSDFNFNKNSSLEVNLSGIKKIDNILLIHNTFSKEADIVSSEEFSDNIFWVLCPLSNQYIEKILPNIALFFKKGVKTCIGTDSYASNTKLSVLSELKEITKNFPQIPFEKLIESACLNGAKALKINDTYGSIEIGKKPGINLISNFDFENMCLKEESKIKVLA